MPTQRKIETVSELTEKMSRMQAVIVADYRGITVAEVTKLRNKIRPLGGEFIVAKNTLALISAKETGYAGIEPALKGPTALCFAYGDVAAVAKAIKEVNAEIKSCRSVARCWVRCTLTVLMHSTKSPASQPAQKSCPKSSELSLHRLPVSSGSSTVSPPASSTRFRVVPTSSAATTRLPKQPCVLHSSVYQHYF